MEEQVYHVPVLLHESIDGLDIKPGGIYVDVTFGGGGHSREILRRLTSPDLQQSSNSPLSPRYRGAETQGGENRDRGSENLDRGSENHNRDKENRDKDKENRDRDKENLGRLFSFDQDEDAEKNIFIDNAHQDSFVNESAPSPWERAGGEVFHFVRSNFRYLKNWMRYYGVDHIDGLLADLGVSSHHFDDETRGFSFRFDAPLDMRMNKRAGMTAADIVNTYDEARLADIFYLYGELKTSRKIAAALVKARQQQEIQTTQQFIDAVEPFFKREREKKDMAKLFQALRIEVNHEMDALREMLLSATELLAPGGRLSVITYHSLEDRIVKNIIKTGNAEGKRQEDFYGRVSTPYRQVNNKVIVPSDEEQQRNPRSRSAKLRIAEKLPEEQ